MEALAGKLPTVSDHLETARADILAFTAFPKELVMAIAGIALLGTIGNSLAAALREENEREPALIAFLVTASGVSFAGIGSAFWGLLAGALTLLIWRHKR